MFLIHLIRFFIHEFVIPIPFFWFQIHNNIQVDIGGEKGGGFRTVSTCQVSPDQIAFVRFYQFSIHAKDHQRSKDGQYIV